MTSIRDSLILALLAGGKTPEEIAEQHGFPLAMIEFVIEQDLKRRTK